MSLVHQLANAAVTIIFAVGMVVVSQLFVASRSAQRVAVGVQVAALPL